ncbi:hypothetical protein VN23_06340 [Janthinobacterium sp. B9-8]|nr:hypothetical protein VN23_06340 [Janthinobacterium sp. B9-8]
MAKPMQKIGRMACTCCGEVIPVKQQANGFAIATCNYCDNKLQAFGQTADSHIRAKMTPVSSDSAPAPTLAPVVAPVQEKKSAFSLFN